MSEAIITQPTHTETELHRFDSIAAAIASIKEQADGITVADHTDKVGAQKARVLRLQSKAIRVDADKLRKELKADALKFERAVEAKAQTIIKPLAEIERALQTKEEIVTLHAEREAAKEREKLAAEYAEVQRKLAILESEKAEREQRESKEKVDAEAKRQHEADIAAAEQRGREEVIIDNARTTIKWNNGLHPRSELPSPIVAGTPDEYFNPARQTDREMLADFAKLIADMPTPPVQGRTAFNLALEVGHRLRELGAFIERECEKL